MSYDQSTEYLGLYPIHVRIGRSRKRYKSGYIDNSGSVVIPPVFDGGGWFSEGLAPVFDGSKWGYINPEGEWVVRPISSLPSRFSHGLVDIHGRTLVSYINRRGETIIDFKYIAGGRFSEGFAWLRGKDGLEYFATTEGRVLNWGPFESAGGFSEGLDPVRIEGNCGFIDRNGSIAIPPRFGPSLAGPFREGLAPAEVDGRYGFITVEGDWAIPPQWHKVASFSDGLAPVFEFGGQLIGYVDHAGSIVITPPERAWTSSVFCQGLASIKTAHGIGFIDTTGAWAIDPVYEGTGSFKYGLCPVIGPGYMAYIRRDGTEVWRGEEVDNYHFTGQFF